MNKKIWIPLVVVALLLAGGVAYLAYSLIEQKEQNEQMQELAELDKKEMESEYQQFANQYSEMKQQLTNDSLIAQLTAEQERTQQLLEELRNVKNNDAREIARLKKELATVRGVLRQFIAQVDSLNRLNQELSADLTRTQGQYQQAQNQIAGLAGEKASLSEKVAIAAQLDATAINMQILDKRSKPTKHINKCRTVQVNFNIARNVTAQSGMRTVYVRVVTPAGTLLGNAGSFEYENKTLPCTMKKTVEYGGEELPVTLYWNVTQALAEGQYNVSVFADGKMIGSRNVSFK